MPLLPRGDAKCVDGGCVTINVAGGGVSSHEALTGLAGGADGEHYHLTKRQWELLSAFAATLEGDDGTVTVYDGGDASTSDGAFSRVLDGGFAPDTARDTVNGGDA